MFKIQGEGGEELSRRADDVFKNLGQGLVKHDQKQRIDTTNAHIMTSVPGIHVSSDFFDSIEESAVNEPDPLKDLGFELDCDPCSTKEMDDGDLDCMGTDRGRLYGDLGGIRKDRLEKQNQSESSSRPSGSGNPFGTLQKPAQQGTPMDGREKHGKKRCAEYFNFGQCGYGVKCRFSHDGMDPRELQRLQRKWKSESLKDVEISGNNAAVAAQVMAEIRARKTGDPIENFLQPEGQSVADVVGDKKLEFKARENPGKRERPETAGHGERKKNKIQLSYDDDDDEDL